MKDTETKKVVPMTTTIAIAILATVLAFPTMTSIAFAQSSSNDFQEFMGCLFSDAGGSTATAQDIENVLQGNSADITEQEIRDCFSPIYNDGSASTTSSDNDEEDDSSSTDDSGNSSDNNSDDEEDSTEETDSTENTDNTEGDDTTDGTDNTDSGADNEDTTSGNTEDPESMANNSQ